MARSEIPKNQCVIDWRPHVAGRGLDRNESQIAGATNGGHTFS
jgi:hypothetical protein